MKFVSSLLERSNSKAWQYCSATRFETPITLVGLTALSVEIWIKVLTLHERAASPTLTVPNILVEIPSNILASTNGTCLSAAA